MKIISKIRSLLTLWVMSSLFVLGLVSCGNEAGIQPPFVNPEQSLPPPQGNTSPDFSVIFGNYFLLQSDCPNDGSPMRVTQLGEGLRLDGAFTFDDTSETLLGFLNNEGLLRFFGSDTAADANCTAVYDDGQIRGVCSYVDGALREDCRFAYDKDIAGVYDFIWNDCRNDGSALTVEQDTNKVTLINGFDYVTAPDVDTYAGIIQAGKILFTIEDHNTAATTSSFVEYSCDAIVSGDELAGRCRNLDVDPTEVCTFGYEQTGRSDDVSLSNDALFPSPAIIPNITPIPVSNMEGTYAKVDNNCEDDDGLIDVSQAGNVVGLVGGFDYQAPDPDLYTGSLDSAGQLFFSILGATDDAHCDAQLLFDTDGVSGFTGSCNVVGDNPEVCSFFYVKL